MFDKEGKVNKVIINNKEQHPNAKVIEVEQADLEHNLFISGYEEGEDERLQKFEVAEESYFVMDGEEIQIAPYSRQFASKTLGQRALAIFAGPLMNFILAFVIFIVLGISQGYVVDKPVMGKLTSDGVAVDAGLKQGDKVQAIDGQSVSTWDDVVKVIQKHPEQQITFTVQRGGKTLDIPITPESRKVGEQTIGLIGVYAPVEKSFIGSITHGATETYTWMKEILTGLGKLVTGQFKLDMLSGPVGIYAATDQVAQSGIYYLMKWAAVLSINLGIVNLLPLPALDGGRLLFFAVEGIRGKPIDRQKEGVVHFIGFALLMLLMLVVTWNDIQKFFL